jgi:hypothetical protein
MELICIIHLQKKMYGLEINQLANLLKDTNPNQNDSDSDEDQV